VINANYRLRSFHKALYASSRLSQPERKGLARYDWRMVNHIDVHPTNSRVIVRVGDVTVADSNQAQVLAEGSLPPRHYFPRDHVRMDLLTASESSTHCPYKGDASYWSMTVEGEEFEDVVWSYENPIPEMSVIAGLLCFYDEQVTVELSG